jgi:YVTN family beta-propeller protein
MRESLSPDGGTAYVSNQGAETVSVLDLTGEAPTVKATVTVGTHPNQQLLDSARHVLYVADSGNNNNDVAVVRVSNGKITGLIPTGWYPTALLSTGNQLLVANGKGLGAGPNNGPGCPNPYNPSTAPDQHSGSMIVGTLSRVPLLIKESRLAKWTRQAGLAAHALGSGTQRPGRRSGRR